MVKKEQSILQYSLVIAHSDALSCRHTRTPPQQYTHHLCTHTRTLPCTPLHTQQSHLHMHTVAAIYAPPVHTLTPTYKYLQISSLQLSQYLFTNIHPCILLQISTMHIFTNIYKYPPMHIFTNICKYPHCHITVPII